MFKLDKPSALHGIEIPLVAESYQQKEQMHSEQRKTPICQRLTREEKKCVDYSWKKKITWTVFLILCEGPGYSGEYRSVRKSELISVDFPSPDSPERQRQSQSEWVGVNSIDAFHTILVL